MNTKMMIERNEIDKFKNGERYTPLSKNMVVCVCVC